MKEKKDVFRMEEEGIGCVVEDMGKGWKWVWGFVES